MTTDTATDLERSVKALAVRIECYHELASSEGSDLSDLSDQARAQLVELAREYPDSELIVDAGDSVRYAVCADCLSYLVNDDLSALDLYNDADDRRKAIVEGCAEVLASADVPSVWIFDGRPEGFMRYACETCAALAGDRFRVFTVPLERTAECTVSYAIGDFLTERVGEEVLEAYETGKRQLGEDWQSTDWVAVFGIGGPHIELESDGYVVGYWGGERFRWPVDDAACGWLADQLGIES
jgi:hypothetical protein